MVILHKATACNRKYCIFTVWAAVHSPSLGGLGELSSPLLSRGCTSTRLHGLMQIYSAHLPCLCEVTRVVWNHRHSRGSGESQLRFNSQQVGLTEKRSLKVNHSDSFVCLGLSASALSTLALTYLDICSTNGPRRVVFPQRLIEHTPVLTEEMLITQKVVFKGRAWPCCSSEGFHCLSLKEDNLSKSLPAKA